MQGGDTPRVPMHPRAPRVAGLSPQQRAQQWRGTLPGEQPLPALPTLSGRPALLTVAPRRDNLRPSLTLPTVARSSLGSSIAGDPLPTRRGSPSNGSEGDGAAAEAHAIWQQRRRFYESHVDDDTLRRAAARALSLPPRR